MALVTGGRSTLNPNAPLFIPAAFRQVEDFSPEWWQLITTSTWFRDYWLSQHQEEDIFNCNNADDEFDGNDIADLLPDAFDFGTEEDFSHMEAHEEANKPSHLALNGTSGNGMDELLLAQRLIFIFPSGISIIIFFWIDFHIISSSL
ncbi:hypothetical protein PVL29_010777 [Vitis rotundifolia]|uniref:Protein EARLY RESPONSIVE TO DEHYDRATION 15 n=1 Tax=Vitis rotundifolia TaxID=103349 RepID=A0AA39DVC3_VITRO|nr:hypothetical protein PVL29_010777 [Vitis rotundifolia]